MLKTFSLVAALLAIPSIATVSAMPVSHPAIDQTSLVDTVRYVCRYDGWRHRRHCYWVPDHRRWRGDYR